MRCGDNVYSVLRRGGTVSIYTITILRAIYETLQTTFGIAPMGGKEDNRRNMVFSYRTPCFRTGWARKFLLQVLWNKAVICRMF